MSSHPDPMLKNYLKTAFRSLWKQKGYSLINLLGLAIGMAACLIILIYIVNELSYDKFHHEHENVYRTAFDGEFSGDFFNVAVSSGAIAGVIMEDFPEVIAVTRIVSGGEKTLLSYEDKNIYENNIYFVDSMFLEIFDFPLLEGDPQTALSEPHSLVLSESIAGKFFEKGNAVGKTIRLNNEREVKITGILEDPPANTHLDFNILASFHTLGESAVNNYEDWGSLNLYTYIRTIPGTDSEELTSRFPDFLLRHIPFLSKTDKIKFRMYLQPVSSIHLHSNLMAEMSPNSDINYIYVFGAIAVIILIIACINFMNLTTARSVNRAREVGIRKVAGAYRSSLIGQFIGESVILSFLAMIIALLVVEITLPIFNRLTSLELVLGVLTGWQIPLALLVLVVFVGIIAGSYPAFYLSSFQPVKVVKGDLYKGKKRSILRNTLVVVQFTISVILLISTVFVFYQMDYFKSKRLGYDEENVLVLPLRGENTMNRFNAMKNDLKQIPGIRMVGSSTSVPTKGLNGIGYQPEGIPEDAPWIIYTIYGDFNLIDALGMNIIEGRGYEGSSPADSNSILINETLKKKLGWEDPVGRTIYGFGGDTNVALKVIGILEDYHFKSLHEPVEPAMIRISNEEPEFIVIRTLPGNLESSLGRVEEVWESYEQTFPFDYFFLDQELDNQYQSEQKMSRLFIYFTILAVFIACLGLLGLASFSAEQRTKEIGIRKVLGASPGLLSLIMVGDFIRWVLIANIIAWPLAWWFIRDWLDNFSYRISIMQFSWVFIVASLVSIVIAILTVLVQAIRISVANPVEALKYE